MKLFLYTCLLLLIPSFFLLGHGLDISVGQKYPAVFVKAEYPGNIPLEFATVKVTFENKPFLESTTDKNGVFCFCPDQAGQWTISVDDSTGHKGSETITVGDDFFHPTPANASDETSQPAGSSAKNTAGTVKKDKKRAPPVADTSKGTLCCYLLKVLLGVMLILGITFLMHKLKKPGEK
ncbi:MAG: DUF4198 domain-containing protein [bacterium]|nr:DUF4198 domain-containing protein [bacterium]